MSERRFEQEIGGRMIAVCRGDLTRESVDAIVNAANEHLAHGGGLAGAIVRAGGIEIQAESRAFAPVPTGGAVATGAGRLPCRRVIHAVGPVWASYPPEESDRLLASAVTSALSLASEEGIASIALPAISSGIFGFPKDRCAEVMIEAVLDYFAGHPASSVRDVRFCNFDEPTVACFEAAWRRRFGSSCSYAPPF
jgi:putative ATPase